MFSIIFFNLIFTSLSFASVNYQQECLKIERNKLIQSVAKKQNMSPDHVLLNFESDKSAPELQYVLHNLVSICLSDKLKADFANNNWRQYCTVPSNFQSTCLRDWLKTQKISYMTDLLQKFTGIVRVSMADKKVFSKDELNINFTFIDSVLLIFENYSTAGNIVFSKQYRSLTQQEAELAIYTKSKAQTVQSLRKQISKQKLMVNKITDPKERINKLSTILKFETRLKVIESRKLNASKN